MFKKFIFNIKLPTFPLRFLFFAFLGSSEERECGCTSLSFVGRLKKNADIILDKKLIRIVAPLMLDKNVSVQSTAVGALRNISLADPDICEQMVVDQDIMTPLCKLLLTFNDVEWKPARKQFSNFSLILKLHWSV